MTTPMSDERLAEIQREHDDSPTTEVADLLAEVKRLKALRSNDMQWEARLAEGVLSGQDAVNELAERLSKAEAAVQRVSALVASASWEHALVKARDVRRALDGTEASR
jgi:hypothetical protein